MKIIVRIGALSAALLCVSACAQNVWVKPGSSQADYNTDSYACEKDARQSGYFGGGIGGSINMKEFFNRCMIAHGWSVQGSETQQAVATQQKQAIADWKAKGVAIKQECKSVVNTPELDILRDKIELSRSATDAPPPFSILSNANYPNDLEKAAIAKWATIRDQCSKKAIDNLHAAPTVNQKDKDAMDGLIALESNSVGRIDGLAADLFQGMITYGEFAKKRLDVAAEYQTAFRDWQKSNNVKPNQ